MTDFIELFEGAIAPELVKELNYTDPKTATFDQKFMQASVALNDPEVVFTSGGKENVATYEELSELVLTDEEKQIVEARKQELSKKAGFHDGDQMLVTKAEMKDGKLVMDLVRTKFTVLNCLGNLIFPNESNLYKTTLYKTGVMSPFITTDGWTCLMERSKDKFYSVAAGFLEPYGEARSLLDLVKSTAFSEMNEEFLADKDGDIRAGIGEIKITNLSVRKMKGGLGTAEFVAPCKLNCTREELETILASNEAKDKGEHTDNRVWVKMTRDGIADAKTALSGKSGRFLYLPILLGAAEVAIADKSERDHWVKEVLGTRQMEHGFVTHNR